MSLQLILGGAGVGKSYLGLQKIIVSSREKPKENFYVIVPEQFTMQTQKELVNMHPDGGIMNIDVLSFERLAYRVFEEVGGGTNPVLEEIGKTFVLQRMVQNLGKDLKILGNNVKKTGTIAQIKSLISELMQYLTEPSDIEDWIASAGDKMLLAYKLSDVKLIYESFLSFIEGKYTLGENVLQVLRDRLPLSDKIRNSTMLIDGFTGFTPIQNEVVSALLTQCKKIYITGTMDEKEDPFKTESPHKLFAMTKRMMHKLFVMCEETHTEIEDSILLSHHAKSRFEHAGALRFLEANLFRYRQITYDRAQDEILVFAAKDPRQEFQIVVNKIHRMVRESGYIYRDFAIITGDLPTYANYAVTICDTYDIPCFVDQKQSILTNPFVELLRALLDMVTSDFSYATVFRFLRSGLTDLSEEEIDAFENYVLALGIRGWKRYSESFVRTSRDMDDTALLLINQIRESFQSSLLAFMTSVKSPAKGQHMVLTYAEAFCTFFERLRIQEKLKQKEVQYKNAGNMEKYKEYAQIYGKVIGLFDKLVEILGDESVKFSDFSELIEAGLSEEKIALIPPRADQVLLGDIERTRLKDVKVLFFVGINDGVIPKASQGGGILSELDREHLKEQEVELAPTAREEMYIQRFYLYLSLTKPKEKLILSYSKAGANGEGRLPAYLIGMMKKLFPKLVISDLSDEGYTMDAIETRAQGVDCLIEGLRDIRQSKDDPVATDHYRAWMELYHAYGKDKDSAYAYKVQRLIDAAFYKNTDFAIDKAVALGLYGENLSNSATRLELFAACAFAHFMKYGLGIKEREEYVFNAADIGNILHSSLENFSKKLAEADLTLRQITEEQGEILADECIEQLVHDYGNTIFHSSRRNEHMISRMKRLLRRTVWALKQQIEAGDFEPGAFEISFDMMEPLYEGASLMLRGRIDRMDVCETEDRVYIKIIDYKTGSTSLDLGMLYYGLQIQLLVYLNAGLSIAKERYRGKEVEPAGVFYYHIKDPYIKIEGEMSIENLKSKQLGMLKLDGLSREEEEIIQLMDTTLEAGGKSIVIPVEYNKNGTLSKRSSVADGDTFQIMERYTKKKICEIGTDILAGEVEAAPYRMEKKSACTYCPYHSICGFDERVEGYDYRTIKKESPDDVIKKMREEEEQ